MTPDEAVTRLLTMMEKPGMYASVQEGYFMQVWLLLEIAGVPADTIRNFMIKMHGNAPRGGEPVSDGYFNVFNAELLKFLKKRGLA